MKERMKEGRGNEAMKKERKEGRKKGRQEGRKEGRKAIMSGNKDRVRGVCIDLKGDLRCRNDEFNKLIISSATGNLARKTHRQTQTHTR